MIFYDCTENGYRPEHKKVKGIRIDRRYTDNPEKILAYKGDKKVANKDWYSKGKNHRVINGFIERDFDEEFYIIEINTLEGLLNYSKKYDTNVCISNSSNYIYNGNVLNTFNIDFHME